MRPNTWSRPLEKAPWVRAGLRTKNTRRYGASGTVEDGCLTKIWDKKEMRFLALPKVS